MQATNKKVQSIPSLMMSNKNEINFHNDTLNQKLIITCLNLNQEKFNCDKLFNFLCLYGNVERVINKFLINFLI